MKPLSVSAYNSYMECAFKFDLERNKGLRPEFEPSYYIFGRAVDTSCNALMLKQEDYKKQCDDVLAELLTKKVQFINGDYDGELVDKDKLLRKCKKLGYKKDNIDEMVMKLLDKEELTEVQRKCLAVCCYESLKVKADLMTKAFQKHVLPKLKNINSVQKEYRWKDEKGYEYIAKIDLRGELDAIKGLGDNKTSSNPNRDYPEGIVEDSLQFAVYSKQTGDEEAFYIVFNKKIKLNREKICSECGYNGTGFTHQTCNNLIIKKISEKGAKERCRGEWNETIEPEAECLIRFGKISKEEQNIAQTALTETSEAIEKKVFPKNLNSCTVRYGDKVVRCGFYNYCRKNDMKGIIKK